MDSIDSSGKLSHCRGPFCRAKGFSLVELLITLVIGGILIMAILSFSRYSLFSIAGLVNYASLNTGNREALDGMTREIRNVRYVKTLAGTAVTFVDRDGVDLEYRFDPAKRALVRTKQGSSRDLLTGCDELQFTAYELAPQTNTFTLASTKDPARANVIRLNWTCSRTILGANVNKEPVQSAKIVIRKNQLRP
jgi:prepilin-type N-terminal cleavage/methylation domain-containing protein